MALHHGTHECVEFDVGDVRLRGERWDPHPESRVKGLVLLAHGGGQTRNSWRSTGETFAGRGWRTVAYDARGHGESDWSPQGVYDTGVLSRDMHAVLRELGEPAVVIGASMGGTTGMVVAGEHPECVRALVLIDALPKMERVGASRIAEFMASGRDGFASLEEAGRAVSAYNPHRPPLISYEGLHKNMRQDKDGRWYWHWDPAFLAFGTEPAAGERAGKVSRAVDHIGAPTVLVRGRFSDVLSDQGVADFLNRLPSARVVEAGAGHMVVGDDNSVFAAAVLDFLDEVDVSVFPGTSVDR
ncbi:alpha/beta hydrolase [Rhodococcus sp. 14C212]|uniref:alpha/beta fold hydrolase n=1 Tax=Rhodococcus sp. 14C212 TaxID=2711209 RepID=UPI0013EB8C70|nr:alpha/beta hydrolase [Rhodococcus sp. 14C212]NGP07409.1 alpha/beta hydrolase [Rhodococcus sp. 14C212]